MDIFRSYLTDKIPADGDGYFNLYDENGASHCEDGPAEVVRDNGAYAERWWIHGKTHREDGPAVTYTNGQVEWWANGHQIE